MKGLAVCWLWLTLLYFVACTELESTRNRTGSKRLGLCPRGLPPDEIEPNCFDEESQCQLDTDCPEEQKCCNRGCGNVCVYPTYTGCQQLRNLLSQQSTSALDADKPHIPMCKDDGKFEDIQCDKNINKCWCVDDLGFELAGTRENIHDLVNCTAPRPCADVLCRMLCPYGFELDNDGCPLCRCRNPCQGVNCLAGQDCQLEEIPCAEEICPPLPTCKKPRSLENLCPFGVPLSSPDNGNPFLCGLEPNKPQCPPNYLCDVMHGNEYGVCCPLDEKIGMCPTVLPLGEHCGSNCSSDMHCNGVSKCCLIGGCGDVCIKPANTTLCLQQKAVVEILLSGNDKSEGYIPQCLENGEFSPRQCSSNGYLCWCVTTNGTIITGTMGPKNRVECKSKVLNVEGRTQDDGNDFSFECEKLACDPPCENGYKYDGKGCKTCECAEPCLDIVCPEQMECILVKTENCFDDNCYPIATCRDTAVHCNWGRALISNETAAVINCEKNTCPETHICEMKHDTGICCPKKIQIEHTKSGECPDFVYEPSMCNFVCQSDSQCEGEFKCCPSKTCGAICVPPKPPRLPTMCEYVRDAGLNIIRPEGNATLAIPVPQCLPDGPYNQMQCDTNEECWCVDEFGVEIIKTRSTNSNMDCKKIRDHMSCLGLICRLGCDFGFVMDHDGCPMCSCRNPCQNASCGPHETCQFLEVDCREDWCPPLPYCVPSMSSARTLPVCSVGIPLMYEYGNEPVICDPFSSYPQCPMTHECMVENPRDNGICCPRVIDTSIEEEEEENPQVIGQCPYLIPIQSESCEYRCSSDMDCKSNKKCCSNGCGTECIEAVLKTACQHQRSAREHHANEVGIPAAHMFMPNCSEGGEFEAVQCHPQSKECWCVDKSGAEIPGTREDSKEKITCFPKTEECEMHYCDLYCPHGYQMDRKGCPACECHDPCKDVKCKNSQEVCRLVHVNCVTQPCPPVPLCLPRLENPCPIGIPLVDNTYGDAILCGPMGQHCPSTHRCHLSPLDEYATCCPKPQVISSCEQLKKKNQHLRKITNRVTFLPKCNRKTGAWDPTQCMESLGLCWCVDADGNQMPGTLIRGVPHCTARAGKSLENTPICEKGTPVHLCPEGLCVGKVCLAYPNATCNIDPCGGCKIQFLDDLNRPVNCNDGLTVCFADVQEFINSGILKTKDVDDDILPDLAGGFEEGNMLPPPVYPPPPPPPSYSKIHTKRQTAFDYENENSQLLPFFESRGPWYDGNDMQAMQSEEQPFSLFTRNSPRTIQFEMRVPQADAFLMPRMPSLINPLPMQQIAEMLSSQPQVQIFGVSQRFTILDHGEPMQITKAGVCPAPSLLSILLSISRGCLDTCTSDYDCPESYKCCVDNCGLSCMKVFVSPPQTQSRSSREECSLVTSEAFNPFICLFASKLCLDDDDCDERERCCSTTCGTQCVEVPTKKYEQNLKPVLLQAAAPRCSVEGGYAITQKQDELSWCVNQFGDPLHYTLTRGIVECDSNGTILSRVKKGPVCRNPEQPVLICKEECLTALCPLHPEATCVADPCDGCSVKFISPEGDVVTCEESCKQPLAVGNCRGFLPRYFFNQTSDKCEQFFYGGCEGNANNFATFQLCEEDCKRPVPLCEQPAHPGPCSNNVFRWFYNKHSHQCENFIYGGCSGNNNNFATKEECENTCPDLVLCPWININGEELVQCNRSSVCSNLTCPGKSDATCIVDPCSCRASYVNQDGTPADCSHATTQVEEDLAASIRTAAISKRTRCQSLLKRHLLMGDSNYIPQCMENGQFYPVQCSRGTEARCWCVDEAGWQLPGSSGFAKGTKICKLVKIKKVEVTLAFKHDDPAYVELMKPVIKSVVKNFLKQLNVESTEVVVDVLPSDIHIMFTLLSDNKVQIAFQLEEMMKMENIFIVLPKSELSVDEKSSHFYHEIDHEVENDNGIAANRINHDILISSGEYNWALFAIFLVLGCIILFFIFFVIPAVIKRKRSKEESVFDEKSKPSLVSLVFQNVRYGLSKKKKSEPPPVPPKVIIQTVEAEYESLQKKKIEGDEQSQCDSTSEGPPAYDDISEKDKNIDDVERL